MPAELESMFYYGETPWHGQGTPVTHALTAAEAIVAAALDWEVKPMPIYVNNLNGHKGFTKIPDRNAIARQTDGKVMAVLGDGYTPVQNLEAFTFFDDVVASKDAKYHTAGSLLGGRWVWLLAKLNGGNGTISIKGDAVDKYLLLMNGHDGTLAFKMFFTPIRVVCYNTLTAADAEAKAAMRKGQRAEMFYARHSETIKGRIEQARNVLGISLKYYEDFAEQARHLAGLQLPAAQLPKLLAAAFGTTGAIKPQDVTSLDDFTARSRERVEVVTRLFEGEGKGLNEPGIKGTKWAAYNAVVEYVDYCKKYGGTDPNDVRLKNALFGGGARIKQRAWDYLQKGK
uniref:Uncharacterized protein n=1 Tax=viral metagenome TaxID=1070528 RepID=A0A6M3KLC7_9ZZZZ